MKLTQDILKSIINYNEHTGIFTWLKPTGRRISVGDTPKTPSTPNKYMRIGIFNIRYPAHRLAFLYMEGYLPENEVDHINRNKLDNRWANLREVGRSCNVRNRDLSPLNKSGVKGVSYDKYRNKWTVRLRYNNKYKYFGRYINFSDAVMARYHAEKKYDLNFCDANSTAYIYLKENNLL